MGTFLMDFFFLYMSNALLCYFYCDTKGSFQSNVTVALCIVIFSCETGVFVLEELFRHLEFILNSLVLIHRSQVQAHGSDAMVDEENCVFFLPHRPRHQICDPPFFLFMKGTGNSTFPR